MNPNPDNVGTLEARQKESMSDYASYEKSRELLKLRILPDRTLKVGDRVRHDSGFEGFVIEVPLYRVTDDNGNTFECAEGFLTRLFNFTEVWRELPEEYKKLDLVLWKNGAKTCACYENDTQEKWIGTQKNINPTDSLIDLLIWVRKEIKP